MGVATFDLVWYLSPIYARLAGIQNIHKLFVHFEAFGMSSVCAATLNGWNVEPHVLWCSVNVRKSEIVPFVPCILRNVERWLDGERML